MLLLALLRRLSQKKICCWFPRCLSLYWFLCCGLWFLLLVPRAASLPGAGLSCKGHGMPPLGIGFSKAFLSAFSRPTTGFSFNCPLEAFSYRRKKKKGRGKKWFPSIEITLLEKLLKLKCALKCIYYLFCKWRQRSSGVVRWGDFHQTQNHSESPSDVIKFHHHSMWSYLSEVWEVSNF